MRIDVHAHLIPESLLETLYEAGVRMAGVPAREGRPPLPAQLRQGGGFEAEQLYSIRRRLADMAEQGVDMQVLSTPPVFFYEREPAQALDLCRKVNDAFAAVVHGNVRRFVAIAALPLQAPETAARELERAVRDLGLRGAEICSNVNGANLDDKSLAPLFAKAQDLDVPLFVHPAGVPGLSQRLGSYYLTNLIGNPMDTTIAAASLIFGGVLREFPRLKVYLAHGGGACPYIAGRWDHGWAVREEAKAIIDRAPGEYLRLLYFDSLVHDAGALDFLIRKVGAGRVMLGTDYPFDMGNYSSVEAIEALPSLSEEENEMILGGNAARLFRIEGW